MKPEHRQLLLQDLCARLPYGVKCADFRYDENGEKVATIDILETIYPNRQAYKYEGIPAIHHISRIKPYLRSMSSMTEEERNEYLSVKMQETERVALAYMYRPEAISEIMDWLNARHFDYRDLIEKGLALEAPEGMYN